MEQDDRDIMIGGDLAQAAGQGHGVGMREAMIAQRVKSINDDQAGLRRGIMLGMLREPGFDHADDLVDFGGSIDLVLVLVLETGGEIDKRERVGDDALAALVDGLL